MVLAEMNTALGGTGTVGGVDSYWFGRRCGFNEEVTRCLDAVHGRLRWTGGKWSTAAKAQVWLGMAEAAGVTVLLDTVLVEPLLHGGTVRGAALVVGDNLVTVRAAVTVDATGDGDVAARAGAEFVYGSEREGLTMWFSLAPHPRPGLTKNNFTSNVDVGDPLDYTRAVLSGRRRYGGHDHGRYVAPRESRHVLGDVRLTLTGQLTFQRWPDVVNVSFSNYDVKGHTTSDWLRLGLLPPNQEVQVPYRALTPRGLDGILVTGKAISATRDALPTIRMQSDLENLGYATGLAAAAAVNAGTRGVDVAALQEKLVALGNLDPEHVAGSALPTRGEAWAREMIAALDDAVPIYAFAFMPFEEVRREPIPFVEVCTAGPRIVPMLREEADRPGSPRNLMVARALAWYGDAAGVPVLLEAVRRELEAGALPHRGHIPCALASPDHGAMPELAMLLHALALTRDERMLPLLEEVVRRLEPTDERLRDPHSGLFHYVDAVCDIAERLGHPGAVPALQRLHAYPLLRGRASNAAHEEDFFLERLGYLEVVIGRALARCGSREGIEVLLAYLDDARRPLARVAFRALRELAGDAVGEDPAEVRDWAAALDHLQPRPWPGEREPYEPWLDRRDL